MLTHSSKKYLNGFPILHHSNASFILIMMASNEMNKLLSVHVCYTYKGGYM